MERPDLVYLIIIVVFGVFSLGSIFFHYIKDEEIEKLRKSVNYYNSTYLSRQGGTSLWNGTMVNYNLKSFDGGKIWYACEYSKNWELKILGEVETVYPGLMKTLTAWDNIKSYVAKNGPIDPNNLSSELEESLSDAKFKLEKNEK